jgi:arsenate reductase
MAGKASLTVYHNARCSKSRCALEFLQEKKQVFEVVEYMKNPLSVEEIKALVALLGIHPEALLRKGEIVFKENFAGKKLTPALCYKAMAQYPELIERPIVVREGKAVIGRPTERILEIL